MSETTGVSPEPWRAVRPTHKGDPWRIEDANGEPVAYNLTREDAEHIAALAATPPTPALTAARLADALMGTSMWRYLQQSASGDPMTTDEWRTYAERNATDILAALAATTPAPDPSDAR